MLRPEVKIFFEPTDVVYGINVHDEIIKHLNKLRGGNHTMDYRHIHLIEEHKRLLLKKLYYIKTLFDCDDSFEIKIDKYSSIVSKFTDIKYIYMKHAIEENNNLYGPLKNSQVIEKVLNVFKVEKQNEKELLNDIYNYLINKRAGNE